MAEERCRGARAALNNENVKKEEIDFPLVLHDAISHSSTQGTARLSINT